MENPNFKKSCFFTGHRIISNEEKPDIAHMTERLCVRLIEKYGVSHFISGAAIGYDTLAANIILDLKKRYPHILLHLYIPCRDQSKLWNRVCKAEWDKLMKYADEKKYIYDGNYIDGCMQMRNTEMVNDAYYGIAFCKRKACGTYSTIKKALRKERFICVLPSGKCFGTIK